MSDKPPTFDEWFDAEWERTPAGLTGYMAARQIAIAAWTRRRVERPETSELEEIAREFERRADTARVANTWQAAAEYIRFLIPPQDGPPRVTAVDWPALWREYDAWLLDPDGLAATLAGDHRHLRAHLQELIARAWAEGKR